MKGKEDPEQEWAWKQPKVKVEMSLGQKEETDYEQETLLYLLYYVKIEV